VTWTLGLHLGGQVHRDEPLAPELHGSQVQARVFSHALVNRSEFRPGSCKLTFQINTAFIICALVDELDLGGKDLDRLFEFAGAFTITMDDRYGQIAYRFR
jgi:hypothetical protein